MIGLPLFCFADVPSQPCRSRSRQAGFKPLIFFYSISRFLSSTPLQQFVFEVAPHTTDMIRQLPLRTAAAAPSRLLLPTCAFQPSSFFTTRLVSTVTTTTSTTQPPSPPPSLSKASKSKTSKPSVTKAPPAPKPRKLTYLVERTGSQSLAVYHDARSGGTRKETIIKKIVGSHKDLKKDILSELEFKKDDVSINPVTGHIMIKVSLNTGQPQRPTAPAI